VGSNPITRFFTKKTSVLLVYLLKNCYYLFLMGKARVNIHAHSLRHDYATRLLEKGTNIKAVQELLGHSKLFKDLTTEICP